MFHAGAVDWTVDQEGFNGVRGKQVIKRFVPQGLIDWRRRRRLRRMAESAGLTLVEHDICFDLVKGGQTLRIRSSHAIYLEHMMENFDYFVDSVVPIQMNGNVLVDMSGPRFHRLKGFSSLPFLFPSHTEPYRTTEEYLDFANLSTGKVVLDIGAYSGVTSIIFAQLVGNDGHVYAFEADELNCECARQNIELANEWMGLGNITLIPKAVWSHSDGVLFSHEGAMGSSAVTITGGGRGSEKKVSTTTLEAIFQENKLNRVDFIKIDIEGGEAEVLEHSVDFLARIKTRLIVEPHMVDGAMMTERCSNALTRAGYRVRIREQVGESEPLIEAEAA